MTRPIPLFFNELHETVRVSIDIEEKKYKNTALGDHRQGKKGKKTTTRPIGLGRHVGRTQLKTATADRSDWVLNAAALLHPT